MCFSLFMVVWRALNTAREGTFSDASNGIRNCNRGEIITIIKCTTSDICHSVFNYYFLDFMFIVNTQPRSRTHVIKKIVVWHISSRYGQSTVI